MLCALTVRRIKPGSFDDFRQAFMEGATPENLPDQWVRFHMVRNVDDPEQVITFGMFDGSVEELRGQDRSNYEKQLAGIAPYVEDVGTDGFFEVVEQFSR